MTERNNFEFDFTFRDDSGYETRLCKIVPTDYLDMSQLDIMLEIYCDFLRSCGFVIGDNAELQLVK